MSSYGWIVTRDHLDAEDMSVMGPRDIPADIERDLLAGKGRAFRMYDDDGELYYSGRFIARDDEPSFGPLDDYGTPNAGATEIRYAYAGGRWETL